MSLADGNIRLQPLSPAVEIEQERVAIAWSELVHRSAEITMSNCTALYDFLDHESCLYLACVEKYVPAKERTDVAAGYGLGHAPRPTLVTIGVIYLTSAELQGTVNIGIALCADSRGEGYATRAVRLLVGWAFTELGCHRVQARIARSGDANSDDALSMFAAQGFMHEGTLRRSLFCPPPTDGTGVVGESATNGEWRDVTTLAVLDTDWALDRHQSLSVKSLWDGMFARHQRESEDMISLEERAERRRLQRQQAKTAADVECPPSGIQEILAEPSYFCQPPPSGQITWSGLEYDSEEEQESQAATPTYSRSSSPVARRRLPFSQARNSNAEPSGSFGVSADGSAFRVQPVDTQLLNDLFFSPQHLSPHLSSHASSQDISDEEDVDEDEDSASAAPCYSSALLLLGPRTTSLSDSSSQVDDDARSVASDLSYGSLVPESDMSEGELVSDPFSTPPRSPSVVSHVSGASSLDSWEILDASGVESLNVPMEILHAVPGAGRYNA